MRIKKEKPEARPVVIRHYGSNHHCSGKGVKAQ